MLRYVLVVVSLLFSTAVWADEISRTKYIPSISWSLDGIVDSTSLGTVTGTTVAATDLDCTGYTSGGALTTNSAGEFICSNDDTGGGGANSFETISVPAGTAPVADSSTDTLTITETSPLVITGTAATDTIDITWSATDIDSAGAIVANAVALGTDTTGNYVLDVADGTGVDGTAAAEGATYTPSLDLTEITCGSNLTCPSATQIDLDASPSVTSITASSTVTGAIVDVSTTDVRLSAFTSCTALETNASGILGCGTDDTGAGGGDPVLIDGTAVVDASGVDLIGGTNGIDITFSAAASPDTATFNIDTTEIAGSKTFGNASTDTIVWTIDRATGIDPTLTFGSGTVTGQVVAATTRFESPGYTAGSVLFADGTAVAQNNSKLFWNNSTGRLGIGTDTPGNGLLTIAGNYVGPASLYNLSLLGNMADSGPSGEFIGIRLQPTISGTTGSSVVAGIEQNIDITNTGTIPLIYGFLIGVDRTGATGTTTSNYGGWIQSENGNGTATITNEYGLRIQHIASGTNTIGTSYNLYFDDSAPASGTAYNIYQAGTELNVFGGAITVAATDPADAGSIRLDNNEAIAWEASPAGTDCTLAVTASEVLTSSCNMETTLDLTVTGGDITLGTTSIFSGGDTASLNNIDAIDATTETTLEAAIDIAGDISGTGLGSVAIGADKVLESHFKAVDAAADEECLTYETTTGDFEWQACGAGSGDITDVYNCASGDCASIAMADGDLLDGTSVNPTTTTEGIILPQNTTCTANTAEGQVCWDTDDNALRIGDGATTTSFGADTNAVKEYWWPCPASLPLEAADSIPPLTKDAGTNLDQLSCGFDDSTDEGRTVVFKVPSDVQAGSTITIRAYWYSAAATTGDIIWDFRHNSGVAEGTDPDAALTTEAAAADTTQGTAGQITVTSWTETLANLGWAANELVYGVFYRDANNASDTLVGDAITIGFSVEIPRS